MAEKKKRVPKTPTLEKCPAEVVLEKHGKLVLSDKEYKEIQKGTVPERIKETWDVNLAEAREMLQCSFYELTTSKPKAAEVDKVSTTGEEKPS